MQIRGPYTPVKVPGYSSELPSAAIQSAKDECDINKIMARYQKTGMIEHFNEQAPQFVDMPDEIDYQNSMGIIADAHSAFYSLPSTVRDRFQNDPAQWLEFIHDAESVDEAMRALGIDPVRARMRPKEAQEGPNSDGPASGPTEASESPGTGRSDANGPEGSA